MPELPEVELAKRFAERHLQGRSIRFVVHDASAPRTTPAEFLAAVEGRRFRSFFRHGKNLFGALDDGLFALHLGMSGKLLRRDPAAEAPKHTRLSFHTGEALIAFVDVRRFGHIDAGREADVRTRAHADELGPDVLALATPKALQEALGAGRGALKGSLMDQSKVAGLGNIQACEALHRAALDPRLRTSDLDGAAAVALYSAIMESIQHTLAHTPGDEVEYMSDGAHVENPFLVYGREGEACAKCRTPIERFSQSGRSTFWCPNCQGAS